MKQSALLLLGIVSGGMITLQSVLNANLGKRAGTLGSVLLLTLVSIGALVILVLVFPKTANWQDIPGISEWHLYIGGVLGVMILAAPIFLVPQIGATATLAAVVVGQLVFAIVIDHFGLFGVVIQTIDIWRISGVVLLILGVIFVSKK